MSLINLAQIKDGVSLAERVAVLEQLLGKLDVKVFPPVHVMGMVLAEEGGGAGTWVRVNQNFETVDFNPEHGTWAGMHTVNNDTYGEFVEIPVTYVKTETLTDGLYAGKNCWWTADGPVDGFHVHPAFIGQDGQPHNLQISSWMVSEVDSSISEEGLYIPGKPKSINMSELLDFWGEMSYNELHAKGWMTDGVRPYNIYDHHFLVRLMLTEFGTPDIQLQTVNGISWDGSNRTNYHGIHDPFGLPNYDGYIRLDGLTTVNGTYQVLAADGSLSMVETNKTTPSMIGWIVSCYVGQVNGVDLGDLFLVSATDSSDNLGSFADVYAVRLNGAFRTYWAQGDDFGAFFIGGDDLDYSDRNVGWRISRCAD